jgi:hypothetical protein
MHLIYAACNGRQLRFRFPLRRVELEIPTKVNQPIAGGCASESSEMLESVLSGESCFIHTEQFKPRDSRRHLCVNAITAKPLVDPEESV